MTNQELIEAAAKIEGKDGKWLKGNCRFIIKDGDYWISWNPLTCNVDAFRLMVDHELLVLPQAGHSVIVDWYGAGDAVEEPFGTDNRAATRRAIVRAVVEKALRKTQRKGR